MFIFVLVLFIFIRPACATAGLFKVRLVTPRLLQDSWRKSNDRAWCRCKSLVRRGRNGTKFEIVRFRSILWAASTRAGEQGTPRPSRADAVLGIDGPPGVFDQFSSETITFIQ